MTPDQEKTFLLQKVQPGLIGLIDGTISTLAPIFAAAYLASTHAALLVGLASALGAAISMGLSEGLSDDGELTGRGSSLQRGIITGGATFIGGTMVFDPRTDPHHHVTCRRCGAVEDVEGPVELDGVLRRARRAGFAVEHAEVVVSGLCRDCRAAA
jgi:hypothetical protein